MDARDFDLLTRAVSIQLPRRRLASVLGLSALGLGSVAEGKKKKKVKKNDFGCVNVGKYCRNDGQCCSGRCEGKKKKRKCVAHDESTCQSGQDSCAGGGPIACTTTASVPGQCGVTTGKAPHCFSGGTCVVCTKDSDCVPQFGVEAACIVCLSECGDENARGTACVTPNVLM